MKTRKESIFGLHFDFHGTPSCGKQGLTLSEEKIREICTEIAPDFIQIDCKGHPGWASYPSKIGNALPEFEKDTLALWRRVTKEEGVALYMHYSGIYDIKYCSEHPDQTCMMPNGAYEHGAAKANGRYVDDLLIPQLSELAEQYGVDGVWIDGECWRTSPDFSEASLMEFQNATGIDLAGKKPAERGDPYFNEYRDYHRDLFRNYVVHYTKELHKRFPDFQIASNWAFSDHMPEKVCADVDFLSGDFSPSDSLNSARYAGRALAQQKMPWDLMSWNFRINSAGKGCYVSKHINQILQEAASVLALGGAYQNYIPQQRDGSPSLIDIRPMKALSDFVRAREPYCFRGRLLHQAAILLSTHDRYLESHGLFSRNGYEKVVGMTALLCDAGHSCEIICEHTLEEGPDVYPMIVIPELYSGLREETAKLLLSYAKEGGNLVLSGRNTLAFFESQGAPYSVIDLESHLPLGASAYDNGQIPDANRQIKPYSFTLDRAYYGTLFGPVTLRAEQAEPIAELCEKVMEDIAHEPLAIRIPYGKGTLTLIGFDIGSQYLSGGQYLHRDLMKKATSDLYDPLARIDSMIGRCDLICLEKEDKTMIQLVNTAGSHANPNCLTDEYIPPVIDIKLSVACDQSPKQVLLHPSERSLTFEYSEGRARIEIDRVDIHEIVELCF